MLSQDSSQDYDRLMGSWTALGKGVATSKLLTNPSDPAQGHTGGQPWPQTSQAYAAMQVLLSCWDSPAGCAALIARHLTTNERRLRLPAPTPRRIDLARVLGRPTKTR